MFIFSSLIFKGFIYERYQLVVLTVTYVASGRPVLTLSSSFFVWKKNGVPGAGAADTGRALLVPRMVMTHRRMKPGPHSTWLQWEVLDL